MKYNNVIFLGLCLGLTTYSALSADSVIKISGRVLDYGCTVSSDSLNFTVDLQKNRSEERRVGKDVSVRVDLGGRRIIKKKKRKEKKKYENK